MDRPRVDPEYWLAKAAQVRASLTRLTDPISRKHLIAAAEAYERLAEAAKEQLVLNEGRANDNRRPKLQRP